jgi:formate/nitrite transporter FocA (FNT family)
MSDNKFTEFNDEDLIAERKRLKTASIINAVLCGFLVGVAVYSSIKHGFGFPTVFPLYFVFILIRNRSKMKSLDAEMESRK